MDLNLPVWSVPALAFASVALLAFLLISAVLERRRVRDRYAAAGARS